MSGKPILGFLELTGCNTCLYTLYYSEEMRKLISSSEIKYWPSIGIVVNHGEDIGFDAVFVAGTVRTKRDLEKLLFFRRHSRIMVAYGTCSIYGGIPGLSALLRREDIIGFEDADEKYAEALTPTIKPITEYVKPDILVPGCPPSIELINRLANILAENISDGRIEKPIYLLTGENLCRNCPRKPKRLDKVEMPGIRSINEVRVEEDKCFLEQGILCMGPVTAAGCGHVCIRMNKPCIGCYGPARGVVDQGLNYISSFTSILMKSSEIRIGHEGLRRELDKIVDPMGYLYRYTLPKSLLTKLVLKRMGVEK